MYNVIYYIPSTYLSYNWKFVHFDHFPPILLPPVSGKGEGNLFTASVQFGHSVVSNSL